MVSSAFQAFKHNHVLDYKGTLIRIEHSTRAKYLRLKYAPKEMTFQLVIPQQVFMRDVHDFLKKAEPWLDKYNPKILSRTDASFGHGSTLSILGKNYTLDFRKDVKKKVMFDGNQLIVSHPSDQHIALLQVWLKKQILHFFMTKSKLYAKKLGVNFKKITIKDTTSRWGSCSQQGHLAYSWRLIFAPQEVAEYLCAHEVSHLLHMNHSPKFWQTVAILCPHYKTHRQWLKNNGPSLFHIFN